MLIQNYPLMEDCLLQVISPNSDTVGTLVARLGHADWRVRVAAAVALEELAAPAAEPALLAALRAEDAAPVYSQPDGFGGAPAGADKIFTINFPPGTTEEQKECWCRRGRVKQAVIWALAALPSVSPAASALLQGYATNQGEDYMVRAAACRALGRVGGAAAAAVLEVASNDGEWCTANEARKSLALIRGATHR